VNDGAQSRHHRQAFDAATRLTLLEQDADVLAAADRALAERLDRINNRLGGILVAVTVAAIMLAINVLVGAFSSAAPASVP